MEELENKNFEEEFLNVLEEPESTLILGDDGGGIPCTSYYSGCTSYCQIYDPTCPSNCKKNTCQCDGTGSCYSNTCVCNNGVCYGDTCSCNTPRCVCYNDTQPTGTTYYWWAAGRIKKYGYYLDVGLETYTLNTARSKFTGEISASSAVNSGICKTITSNTTNVNNIKNTGNTNFYTSGVSNTTIGGNGSNLIIGYVGVASSATTHMTGNTMVSVWARSTTSLTEFNRQWAIVTSTTELIPPQTICKIKEKTFTMDFVSGTQRIQGAYVSINNIATIFPQFIGSFSRESLRTGTEGRIVLCTSSTTSTAITGTVSRRGFNGGAPKAFTAYAGQNDSIQLGNTQQNSDKETITTHKIKEIVPEGISHYIIDNQNLTKNILAEKYCSSTTFNGVEDNSAYYNTVLRFSNTKKIEPSLQYFHNDPVFGKQANSQYMATGLTLSITKQNFATITWDIITTLKLVLPRLQNTNTNTAALVNIWCTVNSTEYWLGTYEVLPGETISETKTISYYSLTGANQGTSQSVTLTLKANLDASVSGVKVIGGTYTYTITSGGGQL